MQGGTACQLHLFQLLDGGEMPVDQRRVGQRPQMLRWLELRRERQQKEQMDVLGHPQLQTGMPSRPVQHQHDLLLGACSRRSGKGVEFDGK